MFGIKRRLQQSQSASFCLICIIAARGSDGSIVFSWVSFPPFTRSITHGPLHLAWWNFARTYTSTHLTVRTILVVIGIGASGSTTGFLDFSSLRDKRAKPFVERLTKKVTDGFGWKFKGR